MARSFPSSTGSWGTDRKRERKRHLASFIRGWTSGEQRGKKAQPHIRARVWVGGTRWGPESLGRNAECHFTRGPRVSSCQISYSPVPFSRKHSLRLKSLTILTSHSYYASDGDTLCVRSECRQSRTSILHIEKKRAIILLNVFIKKREI